MIAERKLWRVDLDNGSQMMIEVWNDGPPTVSFRDDPFDVWGPPFDAVEVATSG